MVPKAQFIYACCVLSAFPFRVAGADGDLLPSLNAMEMLRKGTKTPFDQVERRASDLLRKFPAPRECGQIYSRVAHIYAQSGLVNPEKVVHYARLAVQFPMEADNRVRLCVYAGDACRIMRHQNARTEACKWYLRAAAELSKYDIPAESVSESVPAPYMGLDPEERNKYYADVRAKEKRLAENRMLRMHQRVVKAQLVSLYMKPPFRLSELRQLSADEALDCPLLDEVINHVDKNFEGSRGEGGSPWRWWTAVGAGSLALVALLMVLRAYMFRGRRNGLAVKK